VTLARISAGYAIFYHQSAILWTVNGILDAVARRIFLVGIKASMVAPHSLAIIIVSRSLYYGEVAGNICQF
jgi:hypothetical protein